MKNERCPACGRTVTRSTEQNKRYWVLVHAIAEKPVQSTLYSPETWHIYIKQRFLGSREELLPNGKTVQVQHSTADLDVSEFNDYMTQVEAWASEHGIHLPE